jgi:DNA helicase-2/ATP-dependent DNA helicase PcrA
MVVLHPEYGPGKIVDLSGEGDDRRATVQFAGGAGEKSFIVSYSPLRPVR